MGFRKTREEEQGEQARTREPRVNHRIRVPEVRLIGLDGEQLGIMATDQAQRLALADGVDLVEIAPTARPPVCRLMDYGKFKYMQKKQQQEAKKSATHVEVKEVKFRPKTEKHDFETKMAHARRFLEQGNRLKVTIMFRGREMAFADAQRARLDEIARLLQDIAQVDVPGKMEGRTMSMMMNPKRGIVKAPRKPADDDPVMEDEPDDDDDDED